MAALEGALASRGWDGPNLTERWRGRSLTSRSVSPTKGVGISRSTARNTRNENIKVAVRVRNCRTGPGGVVDGLSCLSVQPSGLCTISHPVDPGKDQTFAYDHAFWSFDRREQAEFATQESVFRSIGESLLDTALLDNFNATLFAYGQTGSGKTYAQTAVAPLHLSHAPPRARARRPRPSVPPSLRYTMSGVAGNEGIQPRIVRALFERAATRHGGMEVSISFLEIYMENVYDLIQHERKPLQIRERPGGAALTAAEAWAWPRPAQWRKVRPSA